MLDDLLASHDLVGKSRVEIVELLGKPTPTDKWNNWDMVYVLSPTSPMPIDHQWLVLRLNDAELVTEYQYVQD